jgi:hypothetical protein
MNICDNLRGIFRILISIGLFFLIMWFATSGKSEDKIPMMILLMFFLFVIYGRGENQHERREMIREFMREHNLQNNSNLERPDINIIRQCISSVDKEEIVGSEECVICLDDYDYDNNVGKLRCNHYYHQKCIERWLMEKTICPLCKYNVLSSNDDESLDDNPELVYDEESLDDNPEPVDSEIALQVIIR